MEDLIQNRLYSTEIEQAIIISIIVDPNLLVDISTEVREEDFYHKKNQIIYRVLLSNMEKFSNIQLDMNVLVDMLKSENYFDEIGGLEYINELANCIFNTSNIDYYKKALLEYSNVRKMMNISRKINRTIEENKLKFDDLFEEVQKDLSNISNNSTNSGLMTITEVIQNELVNMQERIENNQISQVKTGYLQYDEITNGLKPGTLLILAARPAIGKTAFALNIALNVAKSNKRVLIFSLEMGEDELLKRLIAISSKLSASDIANGKISKNSESIIKFERAISELQKLDILLDATASSTIVNIKNKCREAVRRFDKVDLIIIDYLQLISGSNNRTGNREQEISEISRGLKLLSKELKVPILALSQLSRKVEMREGRPMLSDLRESGSIEQDADQVMFLHSSKDRVSLEQEQNYKFDKLEFILAKNRSGSTANILLLFDKKTQSFENPTKEEISFYYSNITNDK